MRLFTINEDDYTVELNKPWIMLIPEFAVLLRRDKGSEGDYRGDKKLKARREFSFIYFDLDFTSPIREWDEHDRRQEAMRYAGLEEKDIDNDVMTAHAVYDQLLKGSSRSLRTLKSVEVSLDQLDNYFETINFTKTDKKGELLHSATQYLGNLEKLGKAYAAIEAFKKRVAEELKGDLSIRGTATLGRKEGKRTDTWNEQRPDTTPSTQQMSFKDISKLIHGNEELMEDNEEEETE